CCEVHTQNSESRYAPGNPHVVHTRRNNPNAKVSDRAAGQCGARRTARTYHAASSTAAAIASGCQVHCVSRPDGDGAGSTRPVCPCDDWAMRVYLGSDHAGYELKAK